MAIMIPDVGEVLALKLIVNKTAQADLRLHLFSNSVTPAESDTILTYTENAESGYAAATLTGSSWSVSNGGGTTTGTYPQVDFTFDEAATINGWFITDSSDTILMMSQAFNETVNILSTGTCSVILNVTLE